VKFQPKNAIILDCSCAREILARIDESSFEIKTDLGLRKTRVRVAGGKVLIEGLPIGFEELKMLAEDVEGVYSLSQEGLSKHHSGRTLLQTQKSGRKCDPHA
jgi:hypothetical protein